MVLLLAGAAAIFLFFGEPRYHGRALSTWLDELYFFPTGVEGAQPQRQVASEEAIRALGVKCIPKLFPTLISASYSTIFPRAVINSSA
jgi:hypothetical protein